MQTEKVLPRLCMQENSSWKWHEQGFQHSHDFHLSSTALSGSVGSEGGEVDGEDEPLAADANSGSSSAASGPNNLGTEAVRVERTNDGVVLVLAVVSSSHCVVVQEN